MRGVSQAMERGGGGDSYQAEARVEGLCEDGVRGVQDELGKEDLVLALVDLRLR